MITRYDSESTPPSAMDEYPDGAFVRYSDYKRLEEAVANALVPLRAADNPPQMKREQFLERCRVVAINILKKGLEIE